MYKVLIKKGFATETTEDDNYSEFYLDLYRNIRDNLKSLENNWITKTAYQRVKKLPYAGFVEHLNFKVKLSDQYIVTRQSPQTIEIFNRWTLQSESIFDIGVDSHRAMMKSIDLTSEYLALGCNRGKIFVFCMKTKELLHKLIDDPALLNCESFAQDVMASRVDCSYLRFSPSGKTLLSCITNNSCQYETLSLRKIMSPREWKITHQQTIHQFNVRRVQMNDSYIYLQGGNNKGIQVRSASSLELINTIAESEAFIKSFQPYDRWIIIAGREQISLWDIELGTCIRQCQMNQTDGDIKTIGLVGEKYIISCHVNCWSSDFFLLGVNVWDLQSLINSQKETLKPTFTFSVSTQSWHEASVDGIRDTSVEKLKVFVDDYQIGCLITWDFDYERREVPVPMLYFMDFTNHFES
ncbi:F-box/WD repeat-containing protein 1A-like isoform X2 [Daphnia pulicaria]|nr:F-box/WD repeat-containing protein 1A-like isoform X2 [Daphnia pulicaria]XP_046642017.1 F-box/WD repeat-containing protein 1A-like isoform X2 [Daphnia pulicaria]